MSSTVSNEEIIDNLTKDLKRTYVKDNDTNINIIELPSSSSNKDELNNNMTETRDYLCSEVEDENTVPDTNQENKQNVDDIEIIDENSLQDRDASLNDKEKEVNTLFVNKKNSFVIVFTIFIIISEFYERSFKIQIRWKRSIQKR